MNVVSIRKLSVSHKGVKVPENQWRDLISQGISERVRSGVKMYQIAEKTGLCITTVSKLFHRETKSPRMSTVVAVMKYLGYKLFAELV